MVVVATGQYFTQAVAPISYSIIFLLLLHTITLNIPSKSAGAVVTLSKGMCVGHHWFSGLERELEVIQNPSK